MNEKIYLWNKEQAPLYDESLGQDVPNITIYNAKGAKTCIVVCAGGGYEIKSDYESYGYAQWLMENGVSAIVTEYRVSPYRYPAPQYDAMRAMRYAKAHAKEYGWEKIGIMGSSAGAHLAGTVATACDDMGYKNIDEIDNLPFKPDFAVLCYPVVSMTDFTHMGSRLNLLGKTYDFKADELSVHKRVTDSTPPMFIWHTAGDDAVPVENSLMLSNELSKRKIPFELHIFQNGPHGLGLAKETDGTNAWGELLLKWLQINNLRQ